jgi:pilus assembly protein CpaF
MKISSKLGDDRRPARTTSGLATAVQARRTPTGPAPAGRRITTRTNGKAASDGATALAVEASALDDLRATVRTAVVSELGPRLADASVEDEELRGLLTKHLEKAVRTSPATVGPAEREDFIDATLADMLGWGVLTPLMADPTVTEVMCNGPDCIYVERAGRVEMTDVRFPSDRALRHVIDRMLAVAGRRVDEASPMADGRLADGSRINAIIPPLSTNGCVLTVRRFPESSMTIADLIARETVSTDVAVFVEAAVRGKLNIVVSGGTSTGKTTLLNVLSSFVPAHERIITIEDAAELRLAQPHVVGLEARPANIEGAGRVTIRDLVRNALRMRPDRIVVGEVRGGEAIDMLQAMNTGHEGSLTTVHANSPRDALLRLETMVLMSGLDLPLRAVREQIASAIDLVVQLERRVDGTRVVSAVTEVQGREGDTITLQEIFTRSASGAIRATGLRPKCAERLAEHGATIPTATFRRTAGPSRRGQR